MPTPRDTGDPEFAAYAHPDRFVSTAWPAENLGRTPEDRAALEALYTTGDAHLDPAQPTITHCHTGERSSHTWFVLTHLLGLPEVRNYDGSWTERGNPARVPSAVGSEPGAVTGVAR